MTIHKARYVEVRSLPRAKFFHNAAKVWRAKRLEVTQAIPTGLSPEILSITATDSTHIRVTFKYAAVDNAALRAPGNYSITPPLSVYTVTPEAAASPTYVDLAIDEQDDGQLYTLGLLRLVRA